MQQGFLNPGDELRLDAVRFIMVAPGMEMASPPPKPAGAAPTAASKMQMWASILLTIAAVAVILVLLTKQ